MKRFCMARGFLCKQSACVFYLSKVLLLLLTEVGWAVDPQLEATRLLKSDTWTNTGRRLTFGGQTPNGAKKSVINSDLTGVSFNRRSANPDDLSKSEVEKLLEVRCGTEAMTVLLHYGAHYGRQTSQAVEALKRARLAAGGTEYEKIKPCQGQRNDELEVTALRFSLRTCGTKWSQRTNATIDYGANLDVDQNLMLYGEKSSNEAWTFPKSRNIGNTVFLEAKPKLHWYHGSDLYSFPIECWSAPFKADEPPKKPFIKHGCPVNDNRGRGLARIHRWRQGRTRVSLNLGYYLMFDDILDSKMVYLHCKVIPCLQSYTKALLGVPKCPISHYCAGDPRKTHSLPSYLAEVPQAHVYAGPILAKEKPGKLDNERDIRCKTRCAQMISKHKSDSLSAVKNGEAILAHATVKHVYVRGISTAVTVLVAFAAFILGLVVMAGLWYLHTRSEKFQKKDSAIRMRNSAVPTGESEGAPTNVSLMLNTQT